MSDEVIAEETQFETESPVIETRKPKIPVNVYLEESEYDLMRELSKVYGTRYAAVTIGRAIKEAIAHLDCQPVEAQDDEDLTDEVQDEALTDEVQDDEDLSAAVEPVKSTSPYNPRKIAVLQSLTGQGKGFAIKYLKARSPDVRIKGDTSTGGKQVMDLIDQTILPPESGKWSRDHGKRNIQVRAARRDLLAYLQTADLEKTPLDIESEQETVTLPEKSKAEKLAERRAARTRHIGSRKGG